MLTCRDCSDPIGRRGTRGSLPILCAPCRRRRGRAVIRLDPRPCAKCGTVFLPDPAHWKSGRFCSAPCRDAWWLTAKNAAYRPRGRTMTTLAEGDATND
jgi:hypothetical protein